MKCERMQSDEESQNQTDPHPGGTAGGDGVCGGCGREGHAAAAGRTVPDSAVAADDGCGSLA